MALRASRRCVSAVVVVIIAVVAAATAVLGAAAAAAFFFASLRGGLEELVGIPSCRRVVTGRGANLFGGVGGELYLLLCRLAQLGGGGIFARVPLRQRSRGLVLQDLVLQRVRVALQPNGCARKNREKTEETTQKIQEKLTASVDHFRQWAFGQPLSRIYPAMMLVTRFVISSHGTLRSCPRLGS